MGQPENKVEKKLCDGVKSIGGRAYKFVSPGSNGVPDRIICLPNGTVIFAELKSPKGALSKQQAFRIKELRYMKQTVVILRSVSEVEAFLGVIGKELR
ncbi:VRR-NUC domain-containing protein [Huintestinicola butyrica]|jgi:hypothetical protein|uniref:VRR-NUC domain-containing protein n=1 Tax=Huintestinicola butyrica TaxID=2981728 RepID=UPI0020590B06|nr:MAG TPA: Nuclease [Caudoviricetes sp.]